MIRVLQVFNSNLVSGPEKSVIPGLLELQKMSPNLHIELVFLEETRIKERQSRSTDYARFYGHKVHAIEVHKRYDKEAIKALSELIEREKFEIVHAQDVKATVYAVEAVKELRKRMSLRLISTFHGFVRQTFKEILYEAYYFWCVSKCQDLVSISKDNYRRLSGYFKNTILKIHLIENRIPKPKLFDNERVLTELKSRVKELPPHPWAVMLARFAPEKNHETLFMALAKIPEEIPFTVWCFGFGPMEKEIRDLAKNLGVEKRVIFAGYLDQAESYLGPFDFTMLTSLAEGLPIALLEASSLGLPFIGSNIPGIRKVLSDESLGFFSDPRDVDALASNILKAAKLTPEEKEIYKKKIIEHMEKHFSHRVWCEEMTRLYEGTL